jgi:UDP-N-acetylmuramoyl-L-alanyl-D-glutamate--2,6-diaminopimelate ligase
MLGTLGNKIGNEEIPVTSTTITTADSVELSAIFNYLKTKSIDTVVMEATSHALALNRVDVLNFLVGIFTNIGVDHLDFHKTLDNYAETKYKIFNLSKNAVVNIDDNYGMKFFDRLGSKPKLSISLKNTRADLYASNINVERNGTYFDLTCRGVEYKHIFVNLMGIFSVYNTLCAMAAARFFGISIENIIGCLNNIDCISGRFEPISNNIGINIIIDYAHTEEQFENTLGIARTFTKGKLISLFGCGGERYVSKRAPMGEMAAKCSDFVVLGEDNPRTEDPAIINSQIEVGIRRTNTPYKSFTDRREAVEYALSIAKEGDTIITMGKGPEKYQEYENRRKVYFSEKEVIENYLKTKNS